MLNPYQLCEVPTFTKKNKTSSLITICQVIGVSKLFARHHLDDFVNNEKNEFRFVITGSQSNENDNKIDRIGLRIASPLPAFSKFGTLRTLSIPKLEQLAEDFTQMRMLLPIQIPIFRN